MNVLIIEDEQIIAQLLESKLMAIDAEIKILNKLRSVKTATTWFNENPEPDLIFADIQLTDGVSFSIFEKFNLSCPIIFTTAYDEYALRAFKVNGIDYLLKPIDDEGLKKALDKAKQLLSKEKMQAPQELHLLLDLFNQSISKPKLFKEKFVVKHLNRWIPIFSKDIAYFTKDSIIYTYTFQGEKYIIQQNTLEEIEEVVDPALFFRATRQQLINMHAIENYKVAEGQKLTIQLKSVIIKEGIDISREKAPVFRKWFDR